jgi:hypothetical protein
MLIFSFLSSQEFSQLTRPRAEVFSENILGKRCANARQRLEKILSAGTGTLLTANSWLEVVAADEWCRAIGR